MTTNPNWEEICSQLQPGQNALEITPIIVRLFYSQFKKLKDLLHTYFGNIIYIIEIIEFQKFIFAELPREKSHLRELVEKFMIHKQQYSPCCLQNRKCIYKYPKQIISETYIDEKGFVQYRCWMRRYLSAPEAAWRIFRYPITMSDPSVLALPIHLQNANISQYTCFYNTSSSASLLDWYFLLLIAPEAGEIFYLRSILLHRAARSWDELKNVNGNIYKTYQEVACEIGLFANESEAQIYFSYDVVKENDEIINDHP
ncbi:7491_t:CDS:2, partial [Gigaspora margarita]